MIIIISLVLLVVLGSVLLYKKHKQGTIAVGIFLMVFPGIFLIICSIILIINPMKVKSNINKFLVTEVTIEVARKTGVNAENTGIQHKIIEANQWLAKQQYYNSTIFGLWIPDEVDNLKPIR